MTNDTQLCNAVTDNNQCGEQYGGDYSEFTPQSCSAPPITGYVAQYSSGDFKDMAVDLLGTAGAEFMQWVGFLAVIAIIGVGVVRFTTKGKK